MELKWEKTTFGELKAGDVFLTSESEDRGGYDIVFLRLGTAADVEEHWGGVNREVYRLVSPEREALEKIVETRDADLNDSWVAIATRMYTIATAALEVKE